MSLADYQPITTVVEIKSANGPIKVTVSGIGADDLTKIFNGCFPEIQIAFALWQKTMDKRFSEIGFFNTLINKTPALVAEIISVGSGEPDQRAAAAKLPIGAQVLLMKEIYRMTLEDVGGLKNLLAILGMVRDELPNLASLQDALNLPADRAAHH